MSANILTHKRLTELLEYKPDTGEFFWKFNRTRGVKKGDKAGSAKNSTGYVQIGIDGIRYTGHRLAWFYMHQKWPYVIDHINQVRHDNRLVNLRNGCYVKNGQNRKVNVNSTTGVSGVSFKKSRNKFRANININGKTYEIGSFDNLELAKEARQFAEEFFWKAA